MTTPELHFLCSQGDLKEIKHVLKTSPSGILDIRDGKNRTILHVVCKKGLSEIVDFVLENGGVQFMDAQDEDGKTALYEACCGGHLDIVRTLLRHGAYINVIASSGNVRASKARQALHAACKYKHLEVVQLLVEKGADINARNNAQETVLYESSREGDADIVSYLLEMGANIEIKNIRGLRPLHAAIREGHLNVVCLLLGNGADANKTVEGKKWTPLHIASQVNHVGIAEALLRYDAEVDAQNEDGQTALYMACRLGYTGIAELLLYHGASPNLRAEGGYTPLHAASWEGQYDTVKLLLEYNYVDIEAQTNFAQTAYNIACERDHYDIAQLLLDCGAKTHLSYETKEQSHQPSPSQSPTPKAHSTGNSMKSHILEETNENYTKNSVPAKTLDRLEIEHKIRSAMATFLSEQPSVVNRWEKVLINLGLDRKKVDGIKNSKTELSEKLCKGLNQWIGSQLEDVNLDDLMAQIIEVLKHNNIGLNSTAGSFERKLKEEKKKYGID